MCEEKMKRCWKRCGELCWNCVMWKCRIWRLNQGVWGLRGWDDLWRNTTFLSGSSCQFRHPTSPGIMRDNQLRVNASHPGERPTGLSLDTTRKPLVRVTIPHSLAQRRPGPKAKLTPATREQFQTTKPFPHCGTSQLYMGVNYEWSNRIIFAQIEWNSIVSF